MDKNALTVITIDFETYYNTKDKYSLGGKYGKTYEEYIRDERFQVIGLSVKVDDAETEFYAPHEIEDWCTEIETTIGWNNVRMVGHNLMFDAAIFAWKYGVYPKELADTLLISRASLLWDKNSLAYVTKQLQDDYDWGVAEDGSIGYLNGKEPQQKGTEVLDANGKRLEDFTDEEYEAYVEYCVKDTTLTYSAYLFFINEFGFPEKEIRVMTMALEMFTYPVMELDDRVLKIMEYNLEKDRQDTLKRTGLNISDIRSDAKFAEALRAVGVEPPTKLNAKGEEKYAFAKTDLPFINLQEHPNQAVRDLVIARLTNKTSHAITRVKSFREISTRGLLAVPIEYYAARTGRFGGGQRINAQNLTRNKPVTKDTPTGAFVFNDDKADRVVKVLGDSVYLAKQGLVENDDDNLHLFGLRDSIHAPKGKVLVVNDLSQIECRVLSWLAGEDELSQAFVEGKDVYKVQASRAFKIPYEEVTHVQRFIGKVQILGLGYMAGINGLKTVLRKDAEKYSDEELQSWVDKYRDSVPNIKKLWARTRKALRALMTTNEIVKLDVHGLLKMSHEQIHLPNGLRLRYKKLKEKRSENGFDEFWYWGKSSTSGRPGWEKTFQGRVVENITQALARIVLTDQMLEIKDEFLERGWSYDDAHLTMQVHDEVVVCCKEELAEEVLKIMQKHMNTTPEWATGLVLGSEGDIAHRYGCAK